MPVQLQRLQCEVKVGAGSEVVGDVGAWFALSVRVFPPSVYFYIMCMSVYLYVCMCTLCVQCP